MQHNTDISLLTHQVMEILKKKVYYCLHTQMRKETEISEFFKPHIPLRVTTTLRGVAWSRCSHSHIP